MPFLPFRAPTVVVMACGRPPADSGPCAAAGGDADAAALPLAPPACRAVGFTPRLLKLRTAAPTRALRLHGPVALTSNTTALMLSLLPRRYASSVMSSAAARQLLALRMIIAYTVAPLHAALIMTNPPYTRYQHHRCPCHKTPARETRHIHTHHARSALHLAVAAPP